MGFMGGNMDFWRFAPPDPGDGPALIGQYEPLLVVCSILIACFAGFAALLIVNRIQSATQRQTRY